MLNVVFLTEPSLESIAIASLLQREHHKLTSLPPSFDGLPSESLSKAQVVLLDAEKDRAAAVELTEMLSESRPSLPVVWLTDGSGDPEICYQAMVCGARGCISKEDTEGFVESLEKVAKGSFLFSKELLVTFLRQLAPMVPVVTPPLSGRKRKILELLQHGLTNQEIAEQTHLSVETVKHYVCDLKETFQVKHRRQFSFGLQSFGDVFCGGKAANDTLDPAGTAY